MTPLQFDGKVAARQCPVALRRVFFQRIAEEISQFSPKEIKGEKIRAQLSGSPIQIQLALKDYDGDDGAFDLAIESDRYASGVMTSLLLDTGSLAGSRRRARRGALSRLVRR